MIDLPTRYTKLKELPGGGMSETYLCRDENLNRKVVLKSVKSGISKEKLLDELAALSSIRSKHVVQVLDVIRDEDGSIHGFVEEFIDGTALTCEPVSDSLTAMRKLYPLACGIADIHGHHRLHRDIKPDNMKLDAEGTLKIFDFGLAKLESNTGTSALFFSEGFTAPEAFVKNIHGQYEFSYALDVFAFGATALWLLNCGQLPPEFKNMPPTVPLTGCDFSSLPCGLPPQVSSSLNATLAANPAKRPTILAIRDVLKRHLLFDRHRMLLTLNGNDYWLDRNNRTTKLGLMNTSISIKYDGFDFVVTHVSGLVQINNKMAAPGTLLTGAAVIVLNANGHRASITADISHPEVES